MTNKLKVAVAGLGRMGAIHALHLHELANESRACEFVAVAEPDLDRARRILAEIGKDIPVFPSVDALAKSGVCNAAVVVTPTENHHEHADTLIRAGYRVLLEKPLTGTLDSDRVFAAELDRHHPDALMLAFRRRFDEPLQYAKQLMESGAIGKVFKVFSALEDSNPAPNGYKSGGILPDMSVHNVDESLWLTGRMPSKALAVGSRVYSHALTTCQEDFDDALLCLWFGEDLLAQSRQRRNGAAATRAKTTLHDQRRATQSDRAAGHRYSSSLERDNHHRSRSQTVTARVTTGGGPQSQAGRRSRTPDSALARWRDYDVGCSGSTIQTDGTAHG